MITENGTVKVTTVHNGNVNKELNRSTFILGIVYTVLGGVLLLLYIVLTAFSTDEVAGEMVLITIGAVLLVFGILFICTCGRINKLQGGETKSEENEFFNDYLITREYVNGEHLSTAKVYYHRIVRVRETKSYIFIYNTRVTALTVDKNNVPENELTTIRSLLGRPVVGEAPAPQAPAEQTAEPEVKTEENADGSAVAEEQQEPKEE